MRFFYTLIALLLCCICTVLAQDDAPPPSPPPPPHPQCPAPLDNLEAHNEASGETAPIESRVSEGDACEKDAPYSQVCVEGGTIAATGEGHAQGRQRQLNERPGRHGKTRDGMTPKPHMRTRKNIVLRRPWSTSTLFYQRRRYTLALLEAQMDLQRRRVSLALSKPIDHMAGRRQRNYELKAGNYWVNMYRPRWIVL